MGVFFHSELNEEIWDFSFNIQEEEERKKDKLVLFD